MIRRYLAAGIGIVCMAMLVASCQKGIEWDLSDEEEVDTGVLSKIAYEVSVVSGGTEKSEKQFFWDTNNQLTEYSQSGTSNGQDISVRYRFTRGTNGKIVRMVEDNYPAAANITSVIRDIYYSGDKLSYMLSTKYKTVGETSDSTAFLYGSNNLISSKVLYTIAFNTAFPFMKEDFSYDSNGNLVTKKMYTHDDADYKLTASIAYTYGTHKAPVQLKLTEAFLTGLEEKSVTGLELFTAPGYLEQLSKTGTNGSIERLDNYMLAPTFAKSDRPLKVSGTINGGAATITYTYK